VKRLNIDRQQLKSFIFSLCAIPSVSGFEKRAHNDICALVGKDFDEIRKDGVGNLTLIKRCGKENAPRILIDTHLDEIGLLVREVCEGGFLRVLPLGGIDVSIMQASDVIIYGKQTLRGVICSTPPHLKKDDELPEPFEVIIDTGLSEKQAKELIEVGTPVGFAPVYSELLNDKIMGKSFDDKACAACAIWAVANTPREAICGDVYVQLSAVEETNAIGGAASAVFAADPDYAMVIDVNLARVPDTKSFETVNMDEGVSISMCAATHRRLTLDTAELCKQKELDHVLVAAPDSTGTNATSINLVGLGVPVVDVGLPLASMHTYNEVISLKDAETLTSLVAEFICDKEIAAKYKREEELI